MMLPWKEGTMNVWENKNDVQQRLCCHERHYEWVGK